MFLVHSPSRIPHFRVLLVHAAKKNPTFFCTFGASSTNPQCFLCVQSVAQMRACSIAFKNSSTKIPHLTLFWWYITRSRKCTRTLQIQKLVLGTRPENDSYRKKSRHPPAKFTDAEIDAKETAPGITDTEINSKNPNFCICIFNYF